MMSKINYLKRTHKYFGKWMSKYPPHTSPIINTYGYPVEEGIYALKFWHNNKFARKEKNKTKDLAKSIITAQPYF
jgi:hypothetical protein